MKKVHILKNGYDFNRIIKDNKPFKYKDYIIYIERIKEENYRFGFSVGKRIGNAVTRNRIKRQLKSIVDEKYYQNGFNCIIIVGTGILSRDFQEMKKNLFYAFEKLKIYNKEDFNEE